MNVINVIALFLLRAYKLFLSPFFGGSCRFFPSCSEYARKAFETHSFLKAFGMTLKRCGACHPFGRAGYDPVEEKGGGFS